jgi:RHS repeat-associated protein
MRAAKGKGRAWPAVVALLALFGIGALTPASASIPNLSAAAPESGRDLAARLRSELVAGELAPEAAEALRPSVTESPASPVPSPQRFSLLGPAHSGLAAFPLECLSYDTPSLSKTRVWGSDEKITISDRLEADLSHRLQEGYGSVYDGIASDPCVYDYKGLRVLKQGALGVVDYVYDDKSVLLETDANGVTLAKYDYGPDRLLSINQQTEGRSFYLFDALGSVTDLTTASGSLRASYKYDAWGNYRATTGGSFNAFGFTGHERDSETGLYYFKARFYDPAVGRFLSEDPVDGKNENPPSLHRYLYAYVNPTVYTDPDGRESHLEALARHFEEQKRAILESTRKSAGFVDFLEKTAAAAGAGLAAKATGLVDTAANEFILAVAPDSQEGKLITNNRVQQVREVVATLKNKLEHPAETAVTLAEAPAREAAAAVRDLASGNAAATANRLASAMETGVEVAALGGVSRLATEALGVETGSELAPPAIADAAETATASTRVPATKTLKSTTLAEDAAGAGLAGGSAETTKSAAPVITDPTRLLPAPKRLNPSATGEPIESFTVGNGGLNLPGGRVHGIADDPFGGFLSEVPVSSQAYVRQNLSTKPEWNAANFVSDAFVPEGVVLQRSTAGPIAGAPGGGPQLEILNFTDRARVVFTNTQPLPPG